MLLTKDMNTNMSLMTLHDMLREGWEDCDMESLLIQ